MIRFLKHAEALVLVYEPDDGLEWIHRRLDEKGFIYLKRTFTLRKTDIFDGITEDFDEYDLESVIRFKIAELSGDYYSFDKDILSVAFNLYIHASVELVFRSFVSEKNISIFSKVNELGVGDIWIGGDHPDAMPVSEFDRLIRLLPNSYELKRYVSARVGSVVRTYFETERDAEAEYARYMSRRLPIVEGGLASIFRNNEISKYKVVLSRLSAMLANSDNYSEGQWQEEILQIILLIYPKYIKAFKEAPVRDLYSATLRKIDLLLVDASGNVDIVEIKKPFDECIVTKALYRDNHIPLRELSGTVMQVEKYIFYLNKSGKTGEDALTTRYQALLPAGLSIKITNPSGIIIMGRNSNLSNDQIQDFEVIKRKYKNVIDIITYDDLLGRLQVMIEQLEMVS
jgi:hypothetical protein